MISAPMSISHRRRALPAATLLLLAACASGPDPTPEASPVQATPRPTPVVTPTPTPTPLPTPSYTNPADDDLVEMIPPAVGGATVARPSVDVHGLTPGDIGEVFGEIGLHFRSLALAYIESPRLTLFAMRMDEPVAVTEDLEPHLPEIGRYVGVAGLDPDEWELEEVGGRLTWNRPGGDGTLAGTRVYTWIADDLAFLLIGVDDELNRAFIAELPGVPAPTPTPSPRPTGTPAAPDTPSPSPSPSP
jgi:hypothetical protein